MNHSSHQILVAVIMALAVIAMPHCAPSEPAANAAVKVETQEAPARYIMSAFTNKSESNLYLYTSPDAANFTPLKERAYTPPETLVRDPSLLHHRDGQYYIAYSAGWTGTVFGLAVSPDLLHWKFLKNVTVAKQKLDSVWSPEWFRDEDGTVHIIVSLSGDGSRTHQAYVLTALDETLTHWSEPVAMRGLEANFIDMFVAKSKGLYHVFVKNEETKYIEHATSKQLTGPYEFVGKDDWTGWGKDLEGPCLLPMVDGHWRLFMDGYQTGTYWSSDSADLSTWTTKKEIAGLSGFVRHCTVIRD